MSRPDSGARENLAKVDAPLALRVERKEPWRDADWQKLWLSVQGRSWGSLAIVPAGTGGPPDFTLTIAVTLARIGIMHLGVPIHVADATRIPLGYLVQFSEEVRRLKQEGELVLIALAAVTENPVTVSLARAADSSVLCILLETMSSSEAKATVERIGAARFLGSAVFHASGRPPSAGRVSSNP
jgi:hypothetical protein